MARWLLNCTISNTSGLLTVNSPVISRRLMDNCSNSGYSEHNHNLFILNKYDFKWTSRSHMRNKRVYYLVPSWSNCRLHYIDRVPWALADLYTSHLKLLPQFSEKFHSFPRGCKVGENVIWNQNETKVLYLDCLSVQPTVSNVVNISFSIHSHINLLWPAPGTKCRDVNYTYIRTCQRMRK